MRKAYFILLSLMLFIGCQLEGFDAGPITQDNKQLFLKEVLDGKEVRSYYEYDEDFRLTKQVFYEDRVYTYEFEYETENHPTSFKIYFDDTHRLTVFLTYEDDLLVQSLAKTPSGLSRLFTEQFEYDELKRMTKRTVLPGIIRSYHVVEYQWENSNVIETTGTFQEFTETITYDYDDKKNPMVEVYRNIGYNHHSSMPITKNNRINQVLTSTSFPGDEETSSNLYSYITPGYPVFVGTKAVDRFGRKTEAELTFMY